MICQQTLNNEKTNYSLREPKDQDKPKKTNWFSRLNDKIVSRLQKKTMLKRKRSTSLDDIFEQKTRYFAPLWPKTKVSLAPSIASTVTTYCSVSENDEGVSEEELRRAAVYYRRKQLDLAAEMEEERWAIYMEYCLF